MNRLFRAVLALIMALTLVSTAAGQADPNCPDAPLPRLVIGAQGRVLPGESNNVRDAASRSGTLTGSIPGEGVFDVLDGPVCADGLNWWQVSYEGLTGWTVEGSGIDYWVEPYEEAPDEPSASPTPQPTPTPALPVRSFTPPIQSINTLSVGAQVRVINDDPTAETITLTVRAQPAGNAVGQVVEGDLLTVIGGSEDADGLRWWQIETASGVQGWVVEGLVNAERGAIYERTLLPLCPVQGERIAYRVSDYLVTSAPDGSDPCLFDLIDELQWRTFSGSLFDFSNEFPISPDGAYILYRSGGRLYRLTQDGSERLNLNPNMYVNWAAWSPDGTRIAVATGVQIATLRADGSSFAVLTTGEGKRPWVGWQSDSETVIYWEQSLWNTQMGPAIEYTFYRVNLREGGLRVLLHTPLELDLQDAAISADGSLLAVTGTWYTLVGPKTVDNETMYQHDSKVRETTWIIDLETETTITELDHSVFWMTWLPDNSGILSFYESLMTIIPLNGDPPVEVDLTGDPLPRNAKFIRWETDTTFLVYIGYGFEIEPSDFGIWRVEISSGEVQRLR